MTPELLTLPSYDAYSDCLAIWSDPARSGRLCLAYVESGCEATPFCVCQLNEVQQRAIVALLALRQPGRARHTVKGSSGERIRFSCSLYAESLWCITFRQDGVELDVVLSKEAADRLASFIETHGNPARSVARAPAPPAELSGARTMQQRHRGTLLRRP